MPEYLFLRFRSDIYCQNIYFFVLGLIYRSRIRFRSNTVEYPFVEFLKVQMTVIRKTRLRYYSVYDSYRIVQLLVEGENLSGAYILSLNVLVTRSRSYCSTRSLELICKHSSLLSSSSSSWLTLYLYLKLTALPVRPRWNRWATTRILLLLWCLMSYLRRARHGSRSIR